MRNTNEPKDAKISGDDRDNQPASEERQEQTDPNLTELKGFTDEDQPLEPAEDANRQEAKKYKEQRDQ